MLDFKVSLILYVIICECNPFCLTYSTTVLKIEYIFCTVTSSGRNFQYLLNIPDLILIMVIVSLDIVFVNCDV